VCLTNTPKPGLVVLFWEKIGFCQNKPKK
jgi:hypothetical protein